MHILRLPVGCEHSFLIQVRYRFAAELRPEIEFAPDRTAGEIGPGLDLCEIRFVKKALVIDGRIEAARRGGMKPAIAVCSVLTDDQRPLRKSCVLVVNKLSKV